MTPNITIRSFSDDQYWLDKVFYTNSYRLRGIKEGQNHPVIVDIGSHCGYFVFTSLALGAKRVYAVESFIENFKILLKNTGENSAVSQFNLAIGNQNGILKIAYPTPQKSHLVFGYPDECNQCEKSSTVSMVTLDNFLSNFIPKEEKIDVLKINIGGQERDILISSNLDNVESICGETVLEPENIVAFKSEMTAKGFVNSHVINNTEEDNKIFFIFSKSEIEKYYSL